MNYHLVNLFDESHNFPTFDFNCKLILITDRDSLWLVFGPLSKYRYHAQLVHKCCVINDIGYSWVKKPDLIEVLDNEIEIKGGGMIKFDKNKQILEFGGHSTAYGKFDKVLLEEFWSNCDEVQDIRILIGT